MLYTWNLYNIVHQLCVNKNKQIFLKLWQFISSSPLFLPPFLREQKETFLEVLLVKWSRSVVSDSSTPWTVAHQAPPSMGASRQEYWSGLPFPSPGDLPDPGIKPWSPAFQADTLTSEPLGNPRGPLNPALYLRGLEIFSVSSVSLPMGARFERWTPPAFSWRDTVQPDTERASLFLCFKAASRSGVLNTSPQGLKARKSYLHVTVKEIMG